MMYIECSERVDSELFIVEGKHAANAVKRVRDARAQAILALQGKLPNAGRVKSQAKLLNNSQVSELLTVVGDNAAAGLAGSSLRYNKIILLTDPDADGLHARVLLVAFFYHQLRSVVEQGVIYMANAPLYCVRSSGLSAPKYIFSAKQYTDIVKQLEVAGINDADVTHFKGLASLNCDELARFCIAPQSRTISRLTVADCAAISAVV